MYLKMRKVKSSKIYTQEWHIERRKRRSKMWKGFLQNERCRRKGGCCNDIRGWFCTGWIRIISWKTEMFFFLLLFMEKIHDLLLIIIIISPPLYPKHIWVYCVYVALQQQQKKYPRFSNRVLTHLYSFTQRKKHERKERKGNFGGKKYEEESIWYT